MTQRHLLSVIAHWEFAVGASATIEALKGFPSYYFNGLSPEDQALVKKYQATQRRIQKDFQHMAEQEESAKPATGIPK